MTVIGSLNYRIGLDASEFVRGATLTRGEYRLLSAAARDTITPQEQFGAAVDSLGTILAKGAIDGQKYFAALVAANEELPALDELQLRLGDHSEAARAAFAAQAEAIATYSAAAASLRGELDAGEISENEYRAAIAAAAEPLRALAAAESERRRQVAEAVQAERDAIATREKNAAAADAMLGKLQQERDTLGMTEAELLQYRLAKLGASAATQQEVAALQAEIDALNKEAAARREAEAAEQAATAARQRDQAAIQSLLGNLQQERDTLGMTEAELLQYRLAKLGASAATQQEAAALQAEIDALNKEAAATRAADQAKRQLDADTDALVASLRDEIATMGMSADQARIYRLQQRGASEASLATARSLADQARAMRTTGTDTSGAMRSIGQQALGAVPGMGQFNVLLSAATPAAGLAAGAFVILAAEIAAVTAATRWVIGETRTHWQEIDKLAKAARGLQIDLQGLQSIRLAGAEMVGLDDGAIDQALRGLQKRIGETAAGTGEARQAFAALGIDAGRLADLPLDQALAEIADRFAEIPNNSERARIAAKLFEEQGLKLLPMLSAGGAAVREYRDTVRELGADVSELDAAAVEKMNDSWGRVGLAVHGLTKGLAVDLSPALTAVAEELVAALKPGSELGDDLRAGLSLIPPVIAWAADQTNSWIGFLEIGEASVLQFGASFLNVLAAIDRAEAAIDPFRAPLDELQIFAAEFQRGVAARFADGAKRMQDGAAGAIQHRAEQIKADLQAGLNAKSNAATTNTESEAEAAAATTKLAADVERLTTSLQEQIATFGMSRNEAELWKLAQAGASEEAITLARSLQQQVDVMQRQAAAESAFDKLNASLLEQIATVGMTADELERYRLAEAGVSEQQLDTIAGLQQWLQATREQQLAAEQLAEGLKKTDATLREQIATMGMSADQVELWKLAQAGASLEQLAGLEAMQQQIAAMKEHADMLKEGEKLAESVMTADEKRAKELERLDALRASGAISEETYARALAKTNAETERNLDLSKGIEGKQKGSLEATLFLENFAASIGRDFTQPNQTVTSNLGPASGTTINGGFAISPQPSGSQNLGPLDGLAASLQNRLSATTQTATPVLPAPIVTAPGLPPIDLAPPNVSVAAPNVPAPIVTAPGLPPIDLAPPNVSVAAPNVPAPIVTAPGLPPIDLAPPNVSVAAPNISTPDVPTTSNGPDAGNMSAVVDLLSKATALLESIAVNTGDEAGGNHDRSVDPDRLTFEVINGD